MAIGVLASLFLTDKPRKMIEEVYSFCEEVGLPTTLAEIGLDGVSDEDLMKVAEKACDKNETIHNEPQPLTSKDVFFALKAADRYGRMRKTSLDLSSFFSLVVVCCKNQTPSQKVEGVRILISESVHGIYF